MGFRYPHYETELLLGVVASALSFVLVRPLVPLAPEWLRPFLLALPMVVLLGVCVWVAWRARRG